MTDLAQLTKDELYDRARREDIEGRSQMTKEELVEALEQGSSPAGDAPAHQLERSTTSQRSVWRGAITFGLITIPVGLYTATEDRDVSFHLLSGDDRSRIRYKRVSTATGEEVDWEDIVKGYEYEKGRYVTFTQEELDRIPSDSLKSIDVAQFTEESEIDPIYFESTYYVAPEEGGAKAYAVLLEALSRAGRVGVGKVTLRQKERLCTLRAGEGVLIIETMKWPDEIRIPDFETLEAPPQVSDAEVAMAQQLIEGLTEPFQPTLFHDTYRERLEEAIQAKLEGRQLEVVEEEPEPEGVVDLMEALRASVEATRAQSRRSA